MPSATLAKIAGQYLDLKQLRPDGSEPETLLAQVATFDTASRAGQYYEGFSVNSKNCMTTSMGTRAFIADCNRLLARCVEQTPNGDPVEIRASIERILDLLRYIDECHDDVIFFADEGGAWQVCVDWPEVLPALFACVAQTSAPEEYARTVVEVINEFDGCRREEQLAGDESELLQGTSSKVSSMYIEFPKLPAQPPSCRTVAGTGTQGFPQQNEVR